jgi:hypothetical protein
VFLSCLHLVACTRRRGTRVAVCSKRLRVILQLDLDRYHGNLGHENLSLFTGDDTCGYLSGTERRGNA